VLAARASAKCWHQDQAALRHGSEVLHRLGVPLSASAALQSGRLALSSVAAAPVLLTRGDSLAGDEANRLQRSEEFFASRQLNPLNGAPGRLSASASSLARPLLREFTGMSSDTILDDGLTFLQLASY
jgi:hypothetical protein